MGDYRRAWGSRIRAARVAAGHSQQSFADAMGVDQAVVSRWERGVIAPRDSRRQLIADELGVPVDVLFRYGNGDVDAA